MRRTQFSNFWHSPYLVAQYAIIFAITLFLGGAVQAQVIISGNDNQALLKDGKLAIDPNGEQSISIIDISGETPFIKATLPILNSIFGPPTNIAITPFEGIALVAEAVKLNEAGDKFIPSDLLHIIDLTANPPKEIDTIRIGSQPSGIAIHPKGHMAIVANRAETTVSVLSIKGDKVTFVEKVDTGEGVTHIAFTPDGRRALATKFKHHKVALLTIIDGKVRYTGVDIPVGQYPYNLDIAPDGHIALVANTGNSGRSDGHVDTVTVIDMDGETPRVIDHVVVGDAPEGIAFSPLGDVAVTGNLAGSDAPPNSPFYNANGTISVLSIKGKKVTHVKDIELGAISESLAFGPEGKMLYVGNLGDRNISILSIKNGKVSDTGRKINLPGHPGSMRGRTRLAD